jgi:hypothetical protein
MPQFNTVDESAALRLLGIEGSIPLTHETMARGLRVTFFPWGSPTPEVAAFAARLERSMAACGVEIVPFERALEGGRRGKVQEGIIIIAPGRLENGKLPVDFVPNLRSNTVVGIIDGACPAEAKTDLQEKLNTIVETLAWSITQVLVYVDDPAWTICTMNGAIIRCDDPSRFSEDVYGTLIPKLAAPVVPPHASDFAVEEGGLDLYAPAWEPYVRDYEVSSPLWAETGLMLFHTSLNSLTFRNTYYKRVAAAYLDRRSGMSYGFLSRQPAGTVPAAYLDDEAAVVPGWKSWRAAGGGSVDGIQYLVLRIAGHWLTLASPEVSVLATRSGCDKSHIDGRRDLVLLGMARGSVFMKTPRGLKPGIDARPSYDTLTILAHAQANRIIASVLKRLQPGSEFVRMVESGGVALAHWHGELNHAVIPEGYVIFGENNPPVSCSTHQAALYTLVGKLRAFGEALEGGRIYRGDVHIEPHHGVNVTWSSLAGLATAILSHADVGAPAEQSATA